ncbi:MAG: hypothetical protein AAB909_02925 [Patescibacteria group bacterium]
MAKDDNSTKAALCYIPVAGAVLSVVFLVLESDNKVLKWHAVQSLLLTVCVAALNFAFMVTVFLAILVPVINIAGFVIQLVLLVKTYQGEKMNLPLVSEWTSKIVK